MKGISKVLRRISIQWLQGLVEILALFPIIFTYGILAIPDETWIWISSLGVFYLVGLILGMYLLKWPRYTHILAGLLITLLSALLIAQAKYTFVLVTIFGNWAFHRGIKFLVIKWEDMFPVPALWLGIAAYLLAGIIYSLAPALKSYFGLITGLGFVYLVVAFFVINIDQLKAAYQSGEDVIPALSRNTLKNNRLLMMFFVVVITAIGCINRLWEGVKWLIKKAAWMVFAIVKMLLNLFNTSGVNRGDQLPGNPMDLFPNGSGGASQRSLFLEKILLILVGAVVLVLLWFGGKTLFRFLTRLYKQLKTNLKVRDQLYDDGGFIDEKENLMDIVDIGWDYVDRFDRWMKKLMENEPKWGDLVDNRQKIRFLYRGLLLKCISSGYIYKNYMTPRETGRDILAWDETMGDKIAELSVIYDNSRYGQEEIEDNVVGEFAETFLKR